MLSRNISPISSQGAPAAATALPAGRILASTDVSNALHLAPVTIRACLVALSFSRSLFFFLCFFSFSPSSWLVFFLLRHRVCDLSGERKKT